VILIDTSAIYALADQADSNHSDAERIMRGLQEGGEELVLNTYILLESFALLHHRHGLAVAVQMSKDLASIRTVPLDRQVHDDAVDRLRRSKRRALSLVDAVSFCVMEKEDIRTASAFDGDFGRAGFELAV
jgi:uncharacterized protein